MNYNQNSISCNHNELQYNPSFTTLSNIQYIFSQLFCQMQIGTYTSKIDPLMVIMAILDAHGCHGQMSIPLLWFHYERLISPKASCAYDSFEDYIHRNASELNNTLTFINNILLTNISKGTLGPHVCLYQILKQIIPDLAGIVAQDGSENHINAKLDVALVQENCSFHEQLFYSTEGIKMHYCQDLLSKGAKQIGFSPANANERNFIDFKSLRNHLILHDAGYYSCTMVNNYLNNKVLFLSRTPSSIRPTALYITIFSCEGNFLESIELHSNESFVEYLREDCIHEISLKDMPDCRLIVAPRTANLGTNDIEFNIDPVDKNIDSNNPIAKAMHPTADHSLKRNFTFYITNLPLLIDAYAICLIYRGRWPVEFNFLSYKSWCGWNTGRYYHPDTVNFICQAATFARLSTVYFGQNLEKEYCNTAEGQYLSFLKCNHLGCLLSKIVPDCFNIYKGKVIPKCETELFDLSLDYDCCLHNAAYGCRISRASEAQKRAGKSFIHNLSKIAAHCYITFTDIYQTYSDTDLITQINPCDKSDADSSKPTTPTCGPDTPSTQQSGTDLSNASTTCKPRTSNELPNGSSVPNSYSCPCVSGTSSTSSATLQSDNSDNITNEPTVLSYNIESNKKSNNFTKLVNQCAKATSEIVSIEDTSLYKLINNWFKQLAPQTRAQYGQGSKQALIATIADVLRFEDKHGPLPSIAPPEYDNIEQIRAWYLRGLMDNIVRGLTRRRQLTKKQGQALVDSFMKGYWLHEGLLGSS